MQKYCVNKNAQSTGEHEVHTYDCDSDRMPNPENRLNLGEFNNCHEAVKEARKYYTNVDGCFYCSRACHTR